MFECINGLNRYRIIHSEFPAWQLFFYWDNFKSFWQIWFTKAKQKSLVWIDFYFYLNLGTVKIFQKVCNRLNLQKVWNL